jgi:hypothetical protein
VKEIIIICLNILQILALVVVMILLPCCAISMKREIVRVKRDEALGIQIDKIKKEIGYNEGEE